jgi:hypothetical protein
MIDPIGMSEQLLFTTVRIETTTAAGLVGTGTGFFFHFKADAQNVIPTIVTNKHVVRGAMTGRFQVHEAVGLKPSSGSFTVALDRFESRWIGHPDSTVDLCAMPFQPLVTEAESVGRVVFRRWFEEGLILSNDELLELNAMQGVTMVGYPIGLWDDVNNLPLLRRGVTATHPAIDFRGRPETVIDMACFPGSSGSPVLLLDEGMVADKRNNVRAGSRMRLLGVLHAAPVMTAEGDIVVEEIPTSRVAKTTTALMIHLGYVIKSAELLTLGNYLKSGLPPL